MTGAVLDLSNHHFHRILGDIQIFGTWVGDSFDESEPALVILPAARSMKGVKPACICLSSAYKYDDPRYLVKSAMIFNKGLGFEDSMACVHKLAGIIHDHLQDLIEMPPRPVRNTFVAADATVTDRDSGRSKTLEIIDHV
jgi:hypothetical protein